MVSHYDNPAEFRRDYYARRDRFQRETVLPLRGRTDYYQSVVPRTLVGHLVAVWPISFNVV